METPDPLRPKPEAAPHTPTAPSPLSLSTVARHQKEREHLFAAIENSNRGRSVVDFDQAGPNGFFSESSVADVNGRGESQRHRLLREQDGDELHHVAPLRTPLATSRAHSPYTQHPTIDFDGLSWPSM